MHQGHLPRLQRHRFDLGDEAISVILQECVDHLEHGITEAADVQDVAAFRGLDRLRRLQVDADQLCSFEVASV